MRWPPMPAGAGGLKVVTTNSEHLMLRIIYIMLNFIKLGNFSRKLLITHSKKNKQ